MRIITVGINYSFKGEYADRVRKIEKNNSIFSKAYWNAEETVEKEMKNEILEYQTLAAKREGEAEGLRKTLSESKKNHSELLKIKDTQLSTLEAKLKNDKMLANNMDKTIATQRSSLVSLANTISNYFRTLAEQINEHQEIKDKILCVNAEKSSYSKAAEEQLEGILNNAKSKHIEEISRLDSELNNLICAPDEIQETINCYKEDGFGSIAGFKEEKISIRKFFGEPVVLNHSGNDVKIPNGILFYGPDEGQNRNFVKATANQYNCNLIELLATDNEEELIEKIYESVELGSEHYAENNRQSILLISEFDKKIQPKSVLSETLKSLLDDVATEYHTTIFATSSNPENIDNILLRDGRFDLKLPLKVKLTYQDFEDYLKYYLDSKLLAKINLRNYAELFSSLQQEGAFSIENLKTIFKRLVPDFSKKDLTNFEKQINLFKNL